MVGCYSSAVVDFWVTVLIVCPVAGCAGQQQFYADLYGVTSDPQKALHVLLDKKEAFSQLICNQLMSRLLGMQCSFPACVAS